MLVGFCAALLFLFVPETFWDRVPHARKKSKKSNDRPGFFRRLSSKHNVPQVPPPAARVDAPADEVTEKPPPVAVPSHRQKKVQVGFAPDSSDSKPDLAPYSPIRESEEPDADKAANQDSGIAAPETLQSRPGSPSSVPRPHTPQQPASPAGAGARSPTSPMERATSYATQQVPTATQVQTTESVPHSRGDYFDDDSESQSISSSRVSARLTYTRTLREMPAQSFVQQLRPWHGRLVKDKWHKVAVRPLILFSYPAVLWSSIVYACSVGWLIVISESIAVIYREGHYNFNALQTGLVYISPFVGGILGTAVAGKVSAVIVKAMARRNGGLYEPEFRLVMAFPVAITTVIGLMGFGWSAQVGNHWMVPTAFFGIVSFGCSLGSTTSITFCVDSYRQYAGEALVTLNFSKNIFHGLVFSLFVTGWLEDDGPKMVYIWIGIIQLILLFGTIPMYIYGKRARMWTVRKNFMERF